MPNASRPSPVVFSHVTKRFGGRSAVRDASFEVPEGSVLGLIGPNGAGKTTTFSTIAGYLRPSEGQVRVLGVDPTGLASHGKRIGVLPQDAALPQGDRVGSFLTFCARLSGMTSSEAERAALAALSEVQGSEWWDRRCGALSHGMAKRVGVAQAFLASPPLVLLDEPTAGLDPKSAYELRELIKRKRNTCTLLISSHNLGELEELCDTAIILDRGNVVSTGTLAELTATSELLRVVVADGPVPLDRVRAVEHVLRAEWNEATRELFVTVARGAVDPPTVTSAVLRALLDGDAKVLELTRGQKLERRVLELTS